MLTKLQPSEGGTPKHIRGPLIRSCLSKPELLSWRFLNERKRVQLSPGPTHPKYECEAVKRIISRQKHESLFLKKKVLSVFWIPPNPFDVTRLQQMKNNRQKQHIGLQWERLGLWVGDGVIFSEHLVLYLLGVCLQSPKKKPSIETSYCRSFSFLYTIQKICCHKEIHQWKTIKVEKTSVISWSHDQWLQPLEDKSGPSEEAVNKQNLDG